MIRYTTTTDFNPTVQPLPARARASDAGVDLSTPVDILIAPGESVWVPTGIAVDVGAGYFGAVRSRSGLRRKHRISTFHGTIDHGYTGQLEVELVRDWYESPPVTIPAGSRIAQLVVLPYSVAEWRRVEALEATERGADGFGSSGLEAGP